MNPIRIALLAGALFALGACNLLSAPIPDPFGLDGETIEVTVEGLDEIRVQVASTASGSASASLNDSSDATGTLTNTVTFEAEVIVTKGVGNENAYPPTITIENTTIEVSIDDGSEDAVSDSGTITTDIVLTRNGDCATTTDPCSYTMEVPAGASISLAIGTVLNNGEEPNDVTATLTLDLESTPGLEPGDTLELTLEAAEGSGSL